MEIGFSNGIYAWVKRLLEHWVYGLQTLYLYDMMVSFKIIGDIKVGGL